MATILLNGVVTDASSISGSDLADKLTVSGGVDELSVNLAGGDDSAELYADSEDVTNAEIRLGAGDDEALVLAEDGTNGNNHNDANDFAGLPISFGDSLLGGPGEDVIRLEDGLVQLTGSIKGNEDDDTIHVANVNGGTVNGNAGDDTLRIGVFADEEAGSRAADALTNGTIAGGKGDDTIIVSADVTDSAVRGNDGDDDINLDGSSFSGATTVNGNIGNDTIDAAGATGDLTVIGGQGDDLLRVGNGQVVRGNRGADIFSIESAGGVTIEDFDKLDLETSPTAEDDCFCDDQIQIDGHKIFYTTYNYDVERVKYTSASSWTGDIKVKAVAAADNTNDTTTATIAAIKTETLSALAVARLVITETKTDAVEGTLPAVSYPAIGSTINGATFANGLARVRAEVEVVTPTNAISGTALRGAGIGQAYASAEGYWINAAGGLDPSTRGDALIRGIIAQTTTNFAKGDFSFLDLTATKKVGVSTNQKLVFNDITQATVKNHWASYNKVKETGSDYLYNMNFGTANFTTFTTGKAYMVLTDLEDRTFKTETINVTNANATAKVTLTLDNAFEAWHKFAANQGTTGTSNSFRRITAAGYFGQNSVPMDITTTGGETDTIVLGATGRYIAETGKFYYSSGITPGGVQLSGSFTTINGVFKRTTGGGDSKVISTPQVLTRNELYWSTLQRRGLLTLSTTAVNPAAFTTAAGNLGHSNVHATPISGNFGKFGINNTNRTKDDYVTASARLVMKIAASATATAKATQAVDTIVRRTTIFGTELPISTCPDFPSAFAAANGFLGAFEVDGQAKQGDITGDFNTNFVWADRSNNLRSQVVTGEGSEIIQGAEGSAIVTVDCSSGSTCVVNEHTIPVDRSNTDMGLTGSAFNALNPVIFPDQAGNGFFSASQFTVKALATDDQGVRFGEFATFRGGDDAKDVPFKVLFFDNAGTDNGLYVVSGLADYNNGALTGIDTVGPAATLLPSATTSNAYGKHTIVKVTGEKGHPIALSDINLV